jgi:hypothetical protein
LTRAILALALQATLRVVQNRCCDFVELAGSSIRPAAAGKKKGP